MKSTLPLLAPIIMLAVRLSCGPCSTFARCSKGNPSSGDPACMAPVPNPRPYGLSLAAKRLSTLCTCVFCVLTVCGASLCTAFSRQPFSDLSLFVRMLTVTLTS